MPRYPVWGMRRPEAGLIPATHAWSDFAELSSALSSEGEEDDALILDTRRRNAVERAPITLARLMVIVGIIAVEIAGFRAVLHRSAELALGLAVTGFACQFGLFCAGRCSGRARAFWAGFVAIGLVMMATFAWGICFPESPMNDLWASYTHLCRGCVVVDPSGTSLVVPRRRAGGRLVPPATARRNDRWPCGCSRDAAARQACGRAAVRFGLALIA